MPVKEYVVGGHTQVIQYGRYAGHPGLHRTAGKVIDITTYASAGETVKKAQTFGQKVRVAAAGRLGQTLGIHEPVVSTGELKCRKPGGGRKANTKPVKYKTKKLVEANAKTIYDNKVIKNLLEGNLKKNFMKNLGKVLVAIATKRARF